MVDQKTKPLVEKTEKAQRTKLSDEDAAFLAKIDGVVTELTTNVRSAFEMVAKFNSKFRARKIPKQKIQTLQNACDRLAAALGDEHHAVVDLRKELAASELAANEVGDIFAMEKKLRKCMDMLEK